MIDVKTPEMAIKTLAMIRIAYNLLRLLMQRAAREAGVPVGSISFKEALDLTTSIHESFRACAGKPLKRADQMGFLVETMSTRVIGHRPGRREPRAVKRRPKPFPLLNKPRHELLRCRTVHATEKRLNPVPFASVPMHLPPPPTSKGNLPASRTSSATRPRSDSPSTG